MARKPHYHQWTYRRATVYGREMDVRYCQCGWYEYLSEAGNWLPVDD